MKRSREDAAERDAANLGGDAGNGEALGLGFGTRDDGGARPVSSGGGSEGGIGSWAWRGGETSGGDGGGWAGGGGGKGGDDLGIAALLGNIEAPRGEERRGKGRGEKQLGGGGRSHIQNKRVGAEIPPSNIGYQLLQKAGWHQGRGLGVAEQGRLNPVPPSLKFDKVGLGGPSSSHVPFSSRPQSAPTLSHTTPPAAGQPHTAQATAGVAGSGFSRAVTDALDNELDVGAGASASDADGGKSRSARRRQKKHKAGQQAEKEQMLQQWLYREFFPDNL